MLCIKGSEFGLMACVRLPRVTNSTWVVMLFRKKGGSWRDCPYFFPPLYTPY